MSSEDKSWAHEYILDPLTAPQPADETGPGASLRPRVESGIATPPHSTDPIRNGTTKAMATAAAEISNGFPELHNSPSSHRQEAFGDRPGRRRGSSLDQRFPGDMSHRPLDQLKQEKIVADKSRHVTKKHHIRPDEVDRLDDAAGGAYHHGGPYDATLLARNNSHNSSPVQAVSNSTAETLKATPKEKIIDSIRGHRPLDGVATYAPGEVDRNGHRYQYEQGENMMIDNDPEGGAYKRWPGVQYHPDDIKGKGEPAYTIERSLKQDRDLGEKGMEMSDRPSSGSLSQAMRAEDYENDGIGMRRSNSITKRLSGGLKKRIGSLKKTSRNEE